MRVPAVRFTRNHGGQDPDLVARAGSTVRAYIALECRTALNRIPQLRIARVQIVRLDARAASRVMRVHQCARCVACCARPKDGPAVPWICAPAAIARNAIAAWAGCLER